jgi:hypothetical protein
MLNVVMLNVVMLNVLMLSVVTLRVVMLNVVAPEKVPSKGIELGNRFTIKRASNLKSISRL